MNLVALGTSGSTANNAKSTTSAIITPSPPPGSFSSISLDDDSGYAPQSPDQQQNNRSSWGLGIVLSHPQEPPIEINGMAGLVTTRSSSHTTKVSKHPPSRIPPTQSNITTGVRQSVAEPASSFFQRLATGITSFMSTASDPADHPTTQIEDMLTSYYLSQGRDVPAWVRDPPPDPPMTDHRRPTSLVLANPTVPVELNPPPKNQSQLTMSTDLSREGSASRPGSSKSVLQSFGRLNISRLTRNPFNKALQSPCASSPDIQGLATGTPFAGSPHTSPPVAESASNTGVVVSPVADAQPSSRDSPLSSAVKKVSAMSSRTPSGTPENNHRSRSNKNHIPGTKIHDRRKGDSPKHRQLDTPMPLQRSGTPKDPTPPFAHPSTTTTGWFRRSRTRQFLSPKLFKRGRSNSVTTESPQTLDIPTVVVANSDEESVTQSYEENDTGTPVSQVSRPTRSPSPWAPRMRNIFKRK